MSYQLRSKLREVYVLFSWYRRLLSALILAKIYRPALIHTKFIAITGSAGKTTTKDLSQLILSSSFPSTSTPETQNTPIIIAKTILATKRQHKFCILELGAFRIGALDLPLWLVKPKIAVLTTIQKDHFRAFKGRGLDGIAEEKAKLIAAVPKDGTAVLNIDDPRVREIGKQCKGKIIWIGKDKNATLRLLDASSRYPESLTLNIEYQGTKHTVVTGLHGTQLATSVLCALGVALAAGIPLEQAITRLRKSVPTEGRMQLVVMEDGVTFIRDDMKAPAWSLSMALQFLGEATAARKIAVIGQISDFSGDDSAKYKQFAKQVREYADLVIFIGPNAYRALRARKDENDHALQGFLTLKEAADYLRKTLCSGDLVLLKGSNKADHLLRLILDRQQPIQCWRERCGFEHFCDSCVYLYCNDLVTNSSLDLQTEFKNQLAEVASQEDGDAPFIIVGLGNPGTEYKNTPHNIGYFVLDRLAENSEAVWQEIDEGQICSIQLAGKSVNLFKAAAYMNETGTSLRRYLAKTGFSPKQCILIHDDADIEFGKIRTKSEGSDAGHLGVRSCLIALGTNQVKRLRLGVKSSGKARDTRKRVLTNFSQEEQLMLLQIVADTIVILGKTVSDANLKQK